MVQLHFHCEQQILEELWTLIKFLQLCSHFRIEYHDNSTSQYLTSFLITFSAQAYLSVRSAQANEKEKQIICSIAELKVSYKLEMM